MLWHRGTTEQEADPFGSPFHVGTKVSSQTGGVIESRELGAGGKRGKERGRRSRRAKVKQFTAC